MKAVMDLILEWNWWTTTLPLILATAFFLSLFYILTYYPTIFFKKHGRKHAFTGLCYLIWITIGFIDLIVPRQYYLVSASTVDNVENDFISTSSPLIPYFLYDIILGILGTYLTLFAAWEFQHKQVKNMASGTLDEHATVTYGEMMEHSFYQVLNLLQIIFIHIITWISYHNDIEKQNIYDQNTIWTSFVMKENLFWRFLALFVVTSWWFFRPYYPINKFSDNYIQVDMKSTTFIRILYRIKKYQYVFYKHFLLHGLNITIALTGLSFGSSSSFRLYWLLLNTSYVMEFFLQTLVKKSIMTQSQMLTFQKILMSASTIAAMMILRHVHLGIAMLSLIANFINRKHDVLNTMLIAVLYVLLVLLVMPEYVK